MSFNACMDGRSGVRAVYHREVTPKCEKAYMTSDAFRVLLRSVGGGSRKGRIAREDGVQLYGWRVIEKDGSLSAIITDIVESSYQSRRTSVTFDVDYEYAIHRDRYLRDLRNQKNFNLLGYIHSHPDHMTHFSQTDVNTMAEYTRCDMEVMLSGLVTLNDGMFELTMYAVTQRGSTMDIWHLPLKVSDREVARRMPACAPKPFGQVWCEASGARMPPDFSLVAIEMDGCAAPEADRRPDKLKQPVEPEQPAEPEHPAEPERPAPRPSPETTPRRSESERVAQWEKRLWAERTGQTLLMGSRIAVIRRMPPRGCAVARVQPVGISFELVCRANAGDGSPDDPAGRAAVPAGGEGRLLRSPGEEG